VIRVALAFVAGVCACFVAAPYVVDMIDHLRGR
jgi:hypothetical protein